MTPAWRNEWLTGEGEAASRRQRCRLDGCRRAPWIPWSRWGRSPFIRAHNSARKSCFSSPHLLFIFFIPPNLHIFICLFAILFLFNFFGARETSLHFSPPLLPPSPLSLTRSLSLSSRFAFGRWTNFRLCNCSVLYTCLLLILPRHSTLSFLMRYYCNYCYYGVWRN